MTVRGGVGRACQPEAALRGKQQQVGKSWQVMLPCTRRCYSPLQKHRTARKHHAHEHGAAGDTHILVRGRSHLLQEIRHPPAQRHVKPQGLEEGQHLLPGAVVHNLARRQYHYLVKYVIHLGRWLQQAHQHSGPHHVGVVAQRHHDLVRGVAVQASGDLIGKERAGGSDSHLCDGRAKERHRE